MLMLHDYSGRLIRLTDERRAHILEHPEMSNQLSALSETLEQPECVIQSLSDEQARLYYRSYSDTPVGAKLLCVIVKTVLEDSFVLTAYFTDARKKGGVLWPEKQ